MFITFDLSIYTWLIPPQLRNGIRNQIKNQPKDIDILHWSQRTALELVGRGGLGHSFDKLEDDIPYSSYSKALKDVL